MFLVLQGIQGFDKTGPGGQSVVFRNSPFYDKPPQQLLSANILGWSSILQSTLDLTTDFLLLIQKLFTFSYNIPTNREQAVVNFTPTTLPYPTFIILMMFFDLVCSQFNDYLQYSRNVVCFKLLGKGLLPIILLFFFKNLRVMD